MRRSKTAETTAPTLPQHIFRAKAKNYTETSSFGLIASLVLNNRVIITFYPGEMQIQGALIVGTMLNLNHCIAWRDVGNCFVLDNGSVALQYEGLDSTVLLDLQIEQRDAFMTALNHFFQPPSEDDKKQTA